MAETTRDRTARSETREQGGAAVSWRPLVCRARAPLARDADATSKKLCLQDTSNVPEHPRARPEMSAGALVRAVFGDSDDSDSDGADDRASSGAPRGRVRAVGPPRGTRAWATLPRHRARLAPLGSGAHPRARPRARRAHPRRAGVVEPCHPRGRPHGPPAPGPTPGGFLRPSRDGRGHGTLAACGPRGGKPLASTKPGYALREFPAVGARPRRARPRARRDRRAAVFSPRGAARGDRLFDQIICNSYFPAKA